MGVNHSGRYVLATDQPLHSADVVSIIQGVGVEGVPLDVDCDPLGHVYTKKLTL